MILGHSFVMSLSNLGELIMSGVMITPRTISHATILTHLFLAINLPNLYKTFAKTFPPICE